MGKRLRFAFLRTVPVLLGFLALGIAFGLLMQRAGYDWRWAFASSLLIYAGSMQFVMVSLLGGGVSLLAAALMTLSVNSRHLFYGLSLIERFSGMGRLRPYMIFSLCDETYSLLCGTEIPPTLDARRTSFDIALLDQCYWIAGSVLGALLGEAISLDLTGVDFAMTALFVVIFLDQWKSAASHVPALIGAAAGGVCLLIFGADGFILPALLVAVGALLIWRRTGREGAADEA